jgi:hypothetical protein
MDNSALEWEQDRIAKGASQSLTLLVISHILEVPSPLVVNSWSNRGYAKLFGG